MGREVPSESFARHVSGYGRAAYSGACEARFGGKSNAHRIVPVLFSAGAVSLFSYTPLTSHISRPFLLVS